jgi:hypothetical protein
VLDEILEERAVSGRGRQVPHRVKRKMSNYPLRLRAPQPITRTDVVPRIPVDWDTSQADDFRTRGDGVDDRCDRHRMP